jgi:hypothetical protein
MRRHLVLTTVAILGLILVARVWAQPPTRAFQGYWMGVDPVDGGDARRSLVQQQDGTFAMIARDSVLTLCDGTDRGVATFDDGVVVGRNRMTTDNLTIRCFNSGAQVVLRVTYELIGNGVMAEVTTTQDGTPVSTIFLHRVSTG